MSSIDKHERMLKRVEKDPKVLAKATAELPPDARPQALWRYRQLAVKAIKKGEDPKPSKTRSWGCGVKY